MNVILPLAGKDPRFPDLPKLLIDVRGKPLIAHILEQLRIESEDQLIFVVLQEDVTNFHIDQTLKNIAGERAIIRVLPNVTEGSPCSILEAARDLIDNETDLLVELGDVLRNIENLYKDIKTRRAEVSGIIPVERRDMTGRPFGYVRTDEQGFPGSENATAAAEGGSPGGSRISTTRFAEALLEKEPTYAAPWATMGLYYFSRGNDFVWAAEEMIKNKSFMYNGMFFVGPIYNELIKRGDKVMISQNTIKTMLGTPEEVEVFCTQYA